MASLLIEPFSGISGDMFLAALASLLHAEDDLRGLPAQLGLDHCEIRFQDVTRGSLRCRRAQVLVGGHAPEEPHSHEGGHGHTHDHRAYRDIVHLLRDHAELPEGARMLALRFFQLLGEAEAEMHGIPLDEVHFHEVGAEDSLLDLVGAALLLDRLRPGGVACTPVCVGSGFVQTAHGRLPVPAPATQRLLAGMPQFPGELPLEMTTPTGAVLLRALDPDFSPATRVLHASAFGAGTRDTPTQPNALRLSLFDPADDTAARPVTLLQTHLDNVSGEYLGADLIADLLADGALDAWISAILMKKGRPGHKLEVLCRPADAERLTQRILRELPTLGVRRFQGSRSELDRSSGSLPSPLGPLAAKCHHLPDGTRRLLPEYEGVRAAARAAGLAPESLYRRTSTADE